MERRDSLLAIGALGAAALAWGCGGGGQASPSPSPAPAPSPSNQTMILSEQLPGEVIIYQGIQRFGTSGAPVPYDLDPATGSAVALRVGPYTASPGQPIKSVRMFLKFRQEGPRTFKFDYYHLPPGQNAANAVWVRTIGTTTQPSIVQYDWTGWDLEAGLVRVTNVSDKSSGALDDGFLQIELIRQR